MVANLEGTAFLEVDEWTVLAIDAIGSTFSLQEAERRLRETHGLEVDACELAELLRSRGFVKSVDGVECLPLAHQGGHRFRGIDLPRFGWLHSGFVASFVALLVFGWLLLLVQHPVLRPHHMDLLVRGSSSTQIFVLLVAFLAVACLHELGHFFMARSFGVNASIHASHRLLTVVLKTNVTGAWILPAKQRIWIFLAGIGVNLFLASTAGLLTAAFHLDWLQGGDAWIRPLQFFVAVNLLPLVYQIFIFARTDLYYVVGAVAGERNLAADSMAYLRYRIGRLAKRWRSPPPLACACGAGLFVDDPFCLRCGKERDVDDPNKFPFRLRNRHVYFVFGSLTVVGRFLTLLLFVFLVLPFLFQLLQQGVQSFQAAWQTGDRVQMLLDAVILAAVFAHLWASLYYLTKSILARAKIAGNRPLQQT